MLYNKHLAKSMERQTLKKTRQYYLKLAEINLMFSTIHQNLVHKINRNDYAFATDYVNQYISYTTVWELKFVYNLENPEVALLQMFHLNYILMHEPDDTLLAERKAFDEARAEFNKSNPFSEEKVIKRYEEMLTYIAEKKNL